jgi:hypothetical protein
MLSISCGRGGGADCDPLLRLKGGSVRDDDMLSILLRGRGWGAGNGGLKAFGAVLDLASNLVVYFKSVVLSRSLLN